MEKLFEQLKDYLRMDSEIPLKNFELLPGSIRLLYKRLSGI